MDFKNFSLHIQDTKVHQFADYLADGKVMATRCKKCGTKYYPPAGDCAKCMSSDMDWFELSGQGKLATYTMVYVPPSHLGMESEPIPFGKYKYEPCPIGIVQMADDLKVMGWIVDIPLQNIKVGMTLKPTAQVLKSGQVTVTLKAAT